MRSSIPTFPKPLPLDPTSILRRKASAAFQLLIKFSEPHENLPQRNPTVISDNAESNGRMEIELQQTVKPKVWFHNAITHHACFFDGHYNSDPNASQRSISELCA